MAVESVFKLCAMLALGLFGSIELLPAVKQGGGLNAGHQQQYQGGEGGIMGNFHI